MAHVISALTYDGSLRDIIVNYALILILLASIVVPTTSGSVAGPRNWPLALLLFAPLQIVLWFFPGFPGVSVIWCGTAGYLLRHFLHRSRHVKGPARSLQIRALVASLLGILYYGWFFPPLATGVHLGSVLLGLALYPLLERAPPARPTESARNRREEERRTFQ